MLYPFCVEVRPALPTAHAAVAQDLYLLTIRHVQICTLLPLCDTDVQTSDQILLQHIINLLLWLQDPSWSPCLTQ